MRVFNLKAQVIIEELKRLGVDYFCIAPGSRATALTYEVGQNPQLRDFIHYDERGLAFHALGYAKATKKPAAIIITSGSSLANVFPAVIEAHYSSIPLLILSGDRPFELIDCGSNQAIDQVKFYQQYVRWHAHLPLYDDALPLSSVCSALCYGYTQSLEGPVHINCSFREPFLESQEVDSREYLNWKNKTSPWCHFERPLAQKVEPISFKAPEKGAIILGKEVEKEDLFEISQLAKQLSYPIFADILAPKSKFLSGKTIENYEMILKTQPDLSFDAILQFGHAFLSKTLLQSLKNKPPLNYLLISKKLRRSDPNHLESITYQVSASSFCQALTFEAPQQSPWLNFWRSNDQKISHYFARYFKSVNHLTEPSALRSIFEVLKDHDILYIASSMPIRDAHTFGATDKKVQIYCNRGASGTDGNLATALGISQGADKPITIVIGDVAFLYDMNSLAMLSELQHPAKIVVFNNQGCGIFNFLPISKNKKVFDRYFFARHTFEFEGAAKQFQMTYSCPKNSQELQQALKSSGHALIEVKTKAEDNFSLHQQIEKELQDALA